MNNPGSYAVSAGLSVAGVGSGGARAECSDLCEILQRRYFSTKDVTSKKHSKICRMGERAFVVRLRMVIGGGDRRATALGPRACVEKVPAGPACAEESSGLLRGGNLDEHAGLKGATTRTSPVTPVPAHRGAALHAYDIDQAASRAAGSGCGGGAPRTRGWRTRPLGMARFGGRCAHQVVEQIHKLPVGPLGFIDAVGMVLIGGLFPDIAPVVGNIVEAACMKLPVFRRIPHARKDRTGIPARPPAIGFPPRGPDGILWYIKQ